MGQTRARIRNGDTQACCLVPRHTHTFQMRFANSSMPAIQNYYTNPHRVIGMAKSDGKPISASGHLKLALFRFRDPQTKSDVDLGQVESSTTAKRNSFTNPCRATSVEKHDRKPVSLSGDVKFALFQKKDPSDKQSFACRIVRAGARVRNDGTKTPLDAWRRASRGRLQ